MVMLLLLMLIPGVVLLGFIVIDLIKKKRWGRLFLIWLVLFVVGVIALSIYVNLRPEPRSEFDPSTARPISSAPTSKIDFQPLQPQPTKIKGSIPSLKDLPPEKPLN